MDEILIGVLTISDRCFNGETTDESGETLVKMIESGIIPNGRVVKTDLVSDEKEDIISVLIEWSEEEEINLILTTGGTGLSERDVTPEATCEVVEKSVPGIPALIFKKSSEITDLACLSRGVAGVRGKSLIINLPGSKKASKECLEAVAGVIPHAIDLLLEREGNVERVHESLTAKKSSVAVGNVACRDRVSPYPCITVDEAYRILKNRVLILKREKTVEYQQALNYVLAKAVIAFENLPGSDVSLKDGYALLSTNKQRQRRVIGVSSPGNPSDVSITEDCCVRISTGAAIPSGADAVVPVEDTIISEVIDDQEEGGISLKRIPEKGQDIRYKGSDFCKGQMILSCDTYVDESALGVLAAVGATSVLVHDKPLVGVLSTGDELINPEDKFQPGKVRDSNRAVLINLLKNEFFEAVDFGICPDHPDALRDSLEKAFETADVVVTTGNMSMGEGDYLKRVLVSDFNAEIFFGRVHMKPGKPTSFGAVEFNGKPKLWFGLPGNPASAFVTSHLFLLPSLRLIAGQKNVIPSVVWATLSDCIPREDRPHYVRGVLEFESEWLVKVNKNQQSSWIGGCVNANCLALIPSIPSWNEPPESTSKNQKVKTYILKKFISN